MAALFPEIMAAFRPADSLEAITKISKVKLEQINMPLNSPGQLLSPGEFNYLLAATCLKL